MQDAKMHSKVRDDGVFKRAIEHVMMDFVKWLMQLYMELLMNRSMGSAFDTVKGCN
jgi:hypothetical protein